MYGDRAARLSSDIDLLVLPAELDRATAALAVIGYQGGSERERAYYREHTPGMLREHGLRDYLVLLSLCQTCRYRDVSFLHFLLSQARDVDTFCERPHQKRPSPPIELYPKGFSHPYLVLHKKCAQRASTSQGETKMETSYSEGVVFQKWRWQLL